MTFSLSDLKATWTERRHEMSPVSRWFFDASCIIGVAGAFVLLVPASWVQNVVGVLMCLLFSFTAGLAVWHRWPGVTEKFGPIYATIYRITGSETFRNLPFGGEYGRPGKQSDGQSS